MFNDNKEFYAHATSKGNLTKMLDEGKIKSLAHVAEDSPDSLVRVEPLPLPMRVPMPAWLANKVMSLTKQPDKVFLTRNSYLPQYGDYVVLKRLVHPKEDHSLTRIPEQHVTTRRLSLRNNARVFVPDKELDYWREKYPHIKMRPKSEIPIKPAEFITLKDALTRHFLSKEAAAIETDSKIKKVFGRNAMRAGSEGLGINVPGTSDVDIFIPYRNKRHFEDRIQKILTNHPTLKTNGYSDGKEYKRVITGSIDNTPVDIVVAYGEPAEKFKEKYLQVQSLLTPEAKQRIIDNKQKLKGAWILPETRYKWYKKRLAGKLGLREVYF